MMAGFIPQWVVCSTQSKRGHQLGTTCLPDVHSLSVLRSLHWPLLHWPQSPHAATSASELHWKRARHQPRSCCVLLLHAFSWHTSHQLQSLSARMGAEAG